MEWAGDWKYFLEIFLRNIMLSMSYLPEYPLSQNQSPIIFPVLYIT